MATFVRCDGCGKESRASRGGYHQDFITVEADDDDECFHACSWSCVAQVAIEKAARDVEVA